MTDDMLLPDLDVARGYLGEVGPPADRMLLCSITGAHHYGFPSADSDLDIKGMHLAPTRRVLGLAKTPGTVDRTDIFRGIECDLTTNEAAQALSLLLRGNGNMLERIWSPFQLLDTAAVSELRELADAYLSRRFAAHYLGFGSGVRREHTKHDAPRAKTLLYVYRVALTGIHLMRTGEVVADVTRLAPQYGFDEVLELVDRKRRGDEKGSVTSDEDKRHRANWERLDALLTEARDASPLPKDPAAPERLEHWLVEQRLALL